MPIDDLCPALGILFVLPHTYLFADARPRLFMTMSVNKSLRMDLHVSRLVRPVTRTVTFRPTSDSNLDIKIEWSTVSNAAGKSKRTRTTESPESVAKRMLFNTLRSFYSFSTMSRFETRLKKFRDTVTI